MIPEKVGFVEYVYLRHFSPVVDIIFGLILLVIVLCLSPILIPYLAYTGWKAEYDEYCEIFEISKKKD